MIPALELRDLAVTFATDRGKLRAVDRASFAVAPGRTLAIVGESGCGKSVPALAIMGLLPPSARIEGSIRLDGREIAALDPEARRKLRGAEMAMIFQEPMTSLNPAFTAGEQVAEALRLRAGIACDLCGRSPQPAPFAQTPHGAIFLVVLAFNLAGDGLRDALDPRSRRR